MSEDLISCIPAIKETCRLLDERQNTDSSERSEARHVLIDYLEGLDYDTIRTIECIMYIGRDCDALTVDYREFSKWFGYNKEGKSLAIGTILGKVQASDYIKAGCSKIGLTL